MARSIETMAMVISRQVTARRALAVSATLFCLVTLVWWGVVFYELIAGGYLSLFAAAQCGVWNSVVCELAQSLCKQYHVLGIKWYSPVAFWVALGLANLWLTVNLIGGD
ncbi:hypothetical protein [Aestuariivirga sp.]|uniref:hypothetical protein n=1 Tax=Aestuariivirga sp. TaxID=2650926 RepID=UPI0039E38084